MEMSSASGLACRAVMESSEVRANGRQKPGLHPSCKSLCREQKKLRHVLLWAQRFLSAGSQVHRDLCEADEMILASEKNEENLLASRETSLSEDETNQNDNGRSDENMNTLEVTSTQELQGSRGEKSKCERENPETEKKDHSSASKVAHDDDEDDDGDSSHDEADSKPDPKQTAGSAHNNLKIPSNLSVYEQYLLCVERLQQMRSRPTNFPKTEQRTRQGITALDDTVHPTTENMSFSVETDKIPCQERRRVDPNSLINVESRSSTDDRSGKTKLVENIIKNKDSPTEVPVCDDWLCLPDEVWLSILSLLPPGDLCRMAQVCSDLYRLTADHTLWKTIRMENAAVSDQWLLSVAKRRPHSLCLYSCGGQNLTCSGQEMFLTLCRDHLKEIKVISCTAASLHGDKILRLTGRLCGHVTSVDVSWSGATDTGVRALSDSRKRLRLQSVVLNGCHVSDEPLKKLIRRHRESLLRLEVFGCQRLTSSCLQTICQMCPGLGHLNIGQVPKVKASSLTLMMSQLKRLLSLNLTGLQAVTDATVDTVLRHCLKLQSLTLSSCPGVTDLTLQNISRFAPCLRSLDVSSCKAVTDTGVHALSLGCRKLEQLDLSSTSTGDRGLSLLASYCSGRLRSVRLSFLHISSEKILQLCRNSQRLQVLHLYGCVQLPTETQIREVNSKVQVYPPNNIYI